MEFYLLLSEVEINFILRGEEKVLLLLTEIGCLFKIITFDWKWKYEVHHQVIRLHAYQQVMNPSVYSLLQHKFIQLKL